MRDNIDGLTDILNMELKSIKVSEELKLRTLEKCKKSKRNSFDKGILPITCTIAACLFIGIITYPIYNKSNLMHKGEISMETSDKDINKLDRPYMDEKIFKQKANTKEDENNKIINNKIVEGNQKGANKNSSEEKPEKEMIVLNEKPIASSKMQSLTQSEDKAKDKAKDMGVASNGDPSNKERSIALSRGNDKDLNSNEETKMKTLSLEEAKKIFQSDIKIPSYIPKDFVMTKILVPEIDNNPYKMYEIIYSNNSQDIKITKYKNIIQDGEAEGNNSIQSKGTEENNMIININKVPVKYTMCEGVDNKEQPYVKMSWEYMGELYGVEGNAPWAELINITSSIIR